MRCIFRGRNSLGLGKEGGLIKERLDRVLVNMEWMEEFSNMHVINLPAMGFDHSPIIVNTDYKDVKSVRKFKFKASWLIVDDCEGVIRKGWERRVEGNKVEQVIRKLNVCTVVERME